eukprot:2075845-Amphidinium_carterae.1
MSPAFVGRDILAALSRPVAMIVPDYALFVCFLLCESDFADARLFKSFKGLPRGALRDRSTTPDLFGMKANMKSYSGITNMELEGTLFTMLLTFH